MQVEITKKFIEELREAAENHHHAFIHEQLKDLHATDINLILYELDTEESKYIMDLLSDEVKAEIISQLDEEIRERFLKNFTSAELARFMSHVDSDDAADILNEQPVRVREEVIALLDDEEKENHIQELLRYEEDVAGGLMAKELIRVNINWDVVQCIDEIRRQAERVEKIYSIYVVDDHERLLGRLSLKKLLLARDGAKVRELYDEDLQYVESFTSEEDVANVMRKYDLVTIPVVNIQKKLLGRITIDDIVDVITEQAELERQLMSGISEDVGDSHGVWALSRSRLPWLIIGMSGGLLGAQLIGFFEYEIRVIPAMAFFIPLITATGGNVGIQSSTIVVQSLANKTGLDKSIAERVFKALMVATVNGIAISGIVFLFIYLLGSATGLSLVVSFALFCVVMISSLVGTVTPVVLDKLNVNPALASGPFITTFNDILGIAVYFGVAKLMLL